MTNEQIEEFLRMIGIPTPECNHEKSFKDCKTKKEAKSLFRKLAKELHPDSNGGKGDPDAFAAMKEEYEQLRIVEPDETSEAGTFTAMFGGMDLGHIRDWTVKMAQGRWSSSSPNAQNIPKQPRDTVFHVRMIKCTCELTNMGFRYDDHIYAWKHKEFSSIMVAEEAIKQAVQQDHEDALLDQLREDIERERKGAAAWQKTNASFQFRCWLRQKGFKFDFNTREWIHEYYRDFKFKADILEERLAMDGNPDPLKKRIESVLYAYEVRQTERSQNDNI